MTSYPYEGKQNSWTKESQLNTKESELMDTPVADAYWLKKGQTDNVWYQEMLLLCKQTQVNLVSAPGQEKAMQGRAKVRV